MQYSLWTNVILVAYDIIKLGLINNISFKSLHMCTTWKRIEYRSFGSMMGVTFGNFTYKMGYIHIAKYIELYFWPRLCWLLPEFNFKVLLMFELLLIRPTSCKFQRSSKWLVIKGFVKRFVWKLFQKYLYFIICC